MIEFTMYLRPRFWVLKPRMYMDDGIKEAAFRWLCFEVGFDWD